MAVSSRHKAASLVEILWRDAAGDASWKDCDDVEPETCYSAAYLIRETPSKLVLALSVSEDGDTFMRFAIPRDWVQKIRKVGESKWVKLSKEKA